MKTEFNWMSTKYGYVFMGVKPATEDDMQQLIDHSPNAEPDKFSLVGRWDPWWTARIYITGEAAGDKPGGIGSHTYEVQKLGAGVEFKPINQEAVFHFNPDGEYVHGVVDYPKTGRAFHRDDYGSTRAGPRAGSGAEKRLGDGSYEWDKYKLYWVIVE